MMAVKRGKAEPVLQDVALCARMGWTLTQLRRQPAKFVELLGAYLSAVDDAESRERSRAQEELESRVRRLRP